MATTADEPGTTQPDKQPSARKMVRPHEPTRMQRVAARSAKAVSQVILASLRLNLDRCSDFLARRPVEQGIYCVWHNRLALCLHMYSGYAQPAGASPGLAAMVSASRDGALLAAVLEAFNVQPIRGSSSRRGGQALLELGRWAKRGYDLAITPDGPRGPRYKVQHGIISLAQVTGLPIYPFSFALTRKISLNSWDRFQVPLPFSHCEVVAAEPIRVPRRATAEEREDLRSLLQASLVEITCD